MDDFEGSMMTIVGMEATTRITTIDEPVSSPAEIEAKARRSLLARAVPNSSPLVAQLSQGTDWAGSPGARRTLERCAAPGAGRDHHHRQER
jgi:hypothetical protein